MRTNIRVGLLVAGAAAAALAAGCGVAEPVVIAPSATGPVSPSPVAYTPDPDPVGFDSSTPEGTQLLLDLVWADTDPQGQEDICGGVELFGAEGAADLLVAATETPLDYDTVVAHLDEVCS